jgi:hypothetical protein
METVPLHGKKAAGRVALVDDEDYELVMQYRWFVWEIPAEPGKRAQGPYAIANLPRGYSQRGIRMHCLILGIRGIDHRDHDGLNNQRSNLRPASAGRNLQNTRPRLAGTSQYKGVCLPGRRKLWHASITKDGRSLPLGDFASELEAAYTYDIAARALFGEFACTNFPEGPTQAMRGQWQAEREARDALMAARMLPVNIARGKAAWEGRQPETRVCVRCGAGYQSRSTNSLYCGYRCRKNASLPAEAERKRQRRASEREERKSEALLSAGRLL